MRSRNRAASRHATLTMEAPPVRLSEAESAELPTDLHIQPGGGRLGEMLVEAGLATREQVVAALEEAQGGSGKRLGQLLVELGTIDERDLARVVATQQVLDVV